MKSNQKVLLACGSTLLALLLFAGCTPKKVPVASSAGSFRPHKILILPFTNMAAIYGQGESVRCPLCGSMLTTGPVKKESAAFLTAKLKELVEKKTGITLVPTQQALGVYTTLLNQNGLPYPEVDIVAKTGRHFGADAVLVGNLYRFRERDGTDYAVKTPASVAFTLVLVRASDGRVIWSDVFDETQKPLLENIFKLSLFFKRKGKWVTAEALAVQGLDQMLQDLPLKPAPHSGGSS